MLTVLQVTPELDTGGVERTTIDIAAAIVAAGGRALVASRGGRMEEELKAAGGELVRMPTHAKDVRLFSNAVALARVARDESVDVIHARSRAPAWSALMAARLGQRSFVTTYHGVYNARSAPKKFYNSVMARGDEVIANSHFIAEHIKTHYPKLAASLTVVPRGADMTWLDPAAVTCDRIDALRRSWGPFTDEPGATILLPGRLTAWKGQEVAIAAFAMLAREVDFLSTRLVLVGDDQGRTAYREQLVRQAEELGVAGRVHLVGHCSDMPAAYALSDIVVSASVEPEAFGRVAVEAQCMGRPVIATAHGGSLETVREGEGGILVPPGDADRLAEALVHLLRASAAERMAMGDRGAARVRREFSVEAMQAATLAVYERVMERGR